MAALYARERTGRGQHISASLFETQISLLINVGASWLNMKREGKRFGAAHPSIVPYNTWQCKDGMWLALAANNQSQFRILCGKIGRPELLEDERFATNALRVQHRKAMDAVLDNVFAAKTVDEWLKTLDGSGLAYGPVNSIERAFAHPQTGARDMIQHLQWDALASGQMRAIGMPVKFSDTKGSIRATPPSLGEHADTVLGEVGYSEDDIRELREKGVV
ncbi:hypothetical protein H2203_004877 [Taxawa tesnikishii (nom. ined.)]|nr:hypothetical protein H2203_004877 [Dothideales sp. JES 119]